MNIHAPPANDNPRDLQQFEFLGMDLSSTPDVTAIGEATGDGRFIIHEVFERGEEPKTPEGRAVFRASVVTAIEGEQR